MNDPNLQLVGFDEGDPRNAAPLTPFPAPAPCSPALSPLLPRPRVLRNPDEPVTGEEAKFATNSMLILLDYLDARYEIGLIANRENQTERAREEALQAMSRLLREINQPYFDARFSRDEVKAHALSAGAATPAESPKKIMLQRDLDETYRRVLLYAAAVVGLATPPA